jgi:putative hydrolase of the HAD superfamily
MSIRAVIFDVGGVLIETVDTSRQQTWERRLGLPVDSLARTVYALPASVRANVGQAALAEVWAEVAQRFGLSASELVQFENDFWSGGVWNTELIDFARSLRPCCKTGIVSNAWPGTREAIAEYVNATDFDAILFSAEVGLAKPDRRIFDLALDRLGVEPGEAMFVDDVLANVEAAKSIGMIGVRFEHTPQVIEEITSYLQT